MKRTLPALALLFSFSLSAQEFVEVSYGQSYKNQTYYRLSDDAVATIDNNAWDIAFTTFGSTDAGIHLNESAASGFPTIEAALYLAPTTNFSDPITPDDLTERLYNDENSWEYGAFNSTRDVNDPADFGWGTLDAGTGNIQGNTVFGLRFKDGTYKKLQIASLVQGVYTLKHADLDGSNETTLTVDKANFPDADFAYLSLASGQTLPSLSIDWDLAFVRYADPNDDGMGGIFQVVSSGVLSAPGVLVAQANDVIPGEVEFADYEDSLSADINVIGADWKTFNNISWELADDRAYFVKTSNGAVWKLVFVEFGGSMTGNVVFTKELVVASGTQEAGAFKDVAIFPNPSALDATFRFSTDRTGLADIMLTNSFGQTVWSGKHLAVAGLNAVQLPLHSLAEGYYFATIKLGGSVLTRKMVKL
ncbi:MAG: HmuY family protein [Saprospiraceae bacterium]